jgi:hypothetical protein
MFARLFLRAVAFGILVIPALAQSPDQPPSESPASTASHTATANPSKKVWTNDDIARHKTGVSVVGDQRNLRYHLSPAPPADPATVDRIKKSLQKLQGELDEVTSRLQSYKQFQDGEPVSKGERDISKGYSRAPVDQQMNGLLDRKKRLESQIGDLFDDARKKGIDPGLLR